MKTYEYRIYPNKVQHQLLMQCLRESGMIYNNMLEMLKRQYEQNKTFPNKNQLEVAFKGSAQYVPASTCGAR